MLKLSPVILTICPTICWAGDYSITISTDSVGAVTSVTSDQWTVVPNCKKDTNIASETTTLSEARATCKSDDSCISLTYNSNDTNPAGDILVHYQGVAGCSSLATDWTSHVFTGVKINPDDSAAVPDKGMPLALLSTYPQGYLLEFTSHGTKQCESWINAAGVTLWSKGLKGCLYLLALFYTFLGIALVADKFMEAIEVITAQTRTVVTTDNNGNEVIVKIAVWNETIANLTLMALGSSAPEILLAVIDTINRLGGPAGDMGPATIVGSASFNLFFIIAICMTSVPEQSAEDSGMRKISEFSVFLITAVFSVFAYVWMYLALTVISPGVIEMWEAITTFGFFPILVFLCYAVDKNCWKKKTPLVEQSLKDHQNFRCSIRFSQNMEKAVATKPQGENPVVIASRLYWRINGIRMITGGKKVANYLQKNDLTKIGTDLHQLPSVKRDETSTDLVDIGMENRAVFNFGCKRYSVREDAGLCTVSIMRKGDLDNIHRIIYSTQDGIAEAPDDYEESSGVLIFKKGEERKDISIKIIPDDKVEGDENFFVTLSTPQGPNDPILGKNCVTEITIIDISFPGCFMFEHQTITIPETKPCVILVKRRNGADDTCCVNYTTIDGTAHAGVDYEQTSGTLSFKSQETEKEIVINLVNTRSSDRNATFTVMLSTPTNGSTIDTNANTCLVVISNDPEFARAAKIAQDAISKHLNFISLGSSTWAGQFAEAMTIGGDLDQGSEATTGDYVMHFLSFMWKVLFAIIPPTDICSGWATFWVALIAVGVVTMIVGELASMWGCMVGLPDFMVAVTIVALGTSLPDTFASKFAVIFSPDADAAITNVTGSNSVNVFLGLGLPWLIATIYHESTNTVYLTPPGSVGFAVAVFSPLAFLALLFLVFRRFYFGAELGGDRTMAQLSGLFLVALWLTFLGIILSQ